MQIGFQIPVLLIRTYQEDKKLIEGECELMEITFMGLLSEISQEKKFNEKYYSLSEFRKHLEKAGVENISINDDYLVLPFYFSEEGTLEMYQYELSINLVEIPSFEKYVLTKTGKENMDLIDEIILKQTKKLYLEVVRPSTIFQTSKLMEYINYIACSEDVKEDVIKSFGNAGKPIEFNEKNLYFVIY